ncbi:hypothetical protein [Streptomyces sp. NPDC059009]|uniref:hypothetical protein n=1 Tax=Streptomyces sp. NPDC059009 TaxID=3346694 RepID=UPI0036C65A46
MTPRTHPHPRIRRHTALAALVALPLALAVTGCGDEHRDAAGGDRSAGASAAPGARTPERAGTDATDAPCPGEPASPTPSPTRPTADTPDTPGDMPPNYADNHAYRSTVQLKGESRCTGLAESARIRGALAPLAQTREATQEQVRAALKKLGYRASAITTGGFGEGRVSYVVDLSPVCLEGSVDGAVGTGVTVEAHGVYVEGTGCEEPRGGH